MFRVIFSEAGEAYGIKTNQALILWSACIDNSEVEAFVERLKARRESAECLIELVKDFVLFR